MNAPFCARSCLVFATLATSAFGALSLWATRSEAISSGSALVDSLNAEINSSTNEALDYVIGDVCVDGADNPIPGDPATCPNHRNIRIGEGFPYLVSDFDTTTGQTYQANFSYPVPGADGTLKVITSKNLQGNFNPGFQFSFSPSRDGFDLMETTSGYFSFIRTSDGGCYDQAWETSPTQLADGWILFQPGFGGSALQHPRWHVELTQPAPAGCATTYAQSVTDVWNPPSQVTYESGKSLSTIVTYDYYSSDMSIENTGMERYFFTREYGFTRWEAWVPLTRCQDPNFPGSPTQTGNAILCDPNNPANPISHRCSMSNIPGLASWGNQTWVRVDCRDTTTYLALSNPVIPLDGPNGSMAQDDGRVDINSAAVFSAQATLQGSINADQSAISQLYEQILGRAADPSGLITYENALENQGWTSQVLATVLASSAEAQGDITQAYQANLGRPPSSSELAFWENQLANGQVSLAQIQGALSQAIPRFFGMGAAFSDDVLPGWPASNAIDGNPQTSYSSSIFPSANNDRGTFLATWLANGPQSVNTAILTARMIGSQPQAFPQSYTIYLTSPDNSTWVDIGTYSTQPGIGGEAVVPLGGSYLTYGVLVIPLTLGVDSYGNPYFQLAEMGLANSP